MKIIYFVLIIPAIIMTSFSQPVQKASVSGKTSGIIVEKVGAVIPAEYNIYSACPNVFGPNTKIKIDVPSTSDIIVNIYDFSGKFISNLVNQSLDAGVYSMEWQPGKKSHGLFSFELISGNFKIERKIALSK